MPLRQDITGEDVAKGHSKLAVNPQMAGVVMAFFGHLLPLSRTIVCNPISMTDSYRPVPVL